MFTTGQTPNGCGHVVRTVYQGIRTTSADFLNDPLSNLKIMTKVHVDKIVLADGNMRRASGVKLKSENGEETTVHVRREVILTSGA